MKLLATLSSLIFLFANTCNSPEGQEELLQLTGTLKATGITSYQYGSHTLTTKDTFYALRSNKVDLSQFEGKTVNIEGEKVEGYPVDGGPDYIEVKTIEEKK
ncbi:MAG TPA: hypothetical protein VIM94_12470 [Salegentibacter sp.]|uniref:hypothetical protein n=1 Tax=Salegentibacter sp. TaxID=1903072 RepID=UPI002F94FA1A